MNNGYLFFWRKILDTSFYKIPLTCRLAEHCILRACYQPQKFILNNTEINLDIGQFFTGYHQLYSETGISIRSLRTGIKTLTNNGFLTSRTTNRFSIITVCKYKQYQKDFLIERQAERQTNDKQTTTYNTSNTEKNNIYSKFAIPTIDQIREYANSIGYGIDAEYFSAYYGQQGWKVGRNPMKDWKAAVRTWKYRSKSKGDSCLMDLKARMA